MQVSLDSNVYIQTYENKTAEIVYVNEELASFKISEEMSENDLRTFGLEILDVLRKTRRTHEYLLQKKQAYIDNPNRDGMVYMAI